MHRTATNPVFRAIDTFEHVAVTTNANRTYALQSKECKVYYCTKKKNQHPNKNTNSQNDTTKDYHTAPKRTPSNTKLNFYKKLQMLTYLQATQMCNYKCKHKHLAAHITFHQH